MIKIVSKPAGLKQPWIHGDPEYRRPEGPHLADLRQGHGDAVELVLTGAGNQGFLRGAEAQAEDVLFVGLTGIIALWVHRNLPKTQDSYQ